MRAILGPDNFQVEPDPIEVAKAEALKNPTKNPSGFTRLAAVSLGGPIDPA